MTSRSWNDARSNTPHLHDGMGTPITGTQTDLTALWAALLLAIGDMRQVEAACAGVAKLDGETDTHLVRALHTAIVVCYARPFLTNKGVLKPTSEWTPPRGDPARKIHLHVLSL